MVTVLPSKETAATRSAGPSWARSFSRRSSTRSRSRLIEKKSSMKRRKLVPTGSLASRFGTAATSPPSVSRASPSSISVK